MMLLGVFLIFSISLQQTPPPAPAPEATRPCALSSKEQPTRKPSPAKKGQVRKAEDTSADKCVEVRGLALDAQEYLQKVVRERRWTILGEHLSEDMWNFSVELNPADLLRYTKPQPDQARMNWSRGRASVRVATTVLPDGYTRVMVSAHFDGFGESDDQFAMKRESWPMESSGALESLLISALQTRVSTTH